MKAFLKDLAKSVIKEFVLTTRSEIQNQFMPYQREFEIQDNKFYALRKVLQDIESETLFLKKQAVTQPNIDYRKRYEYNILLLKEFANDLNAVIHNIEKIM